MKDKRLKTALEDLAWWISQQLDGCPTIFSDEDLQAELYKRVKEYNRL